MSRQYGVHDSLMANLPGISTSSSYQEAKYSQNNKVEAMLPPLEILVVPNRAPIAKLSYRTSLSSKPEQKEHLPSISELVPELPVCSSRAFSPRTRSEGDHKTYSSNAYSKFSSLRSTPSPRFESKRRKLSTDGEEAQTQCDGGDTRLPEFNSPTRQWSRVKQNGPCISDLLMSPRKRSTLSDINTWTQSSKPNSLRTSINSNRYSPLSFQNIRRSTSEPKHFSGPTSPQRSETSSRSTSEAQNHFDKEFQGLNWLNTSDAQSRVSKKTFDLVPLHDFRTQEGYRCALSSRSLANPMSNILRPGFLEDEYSYEPLGKTDNEKSQRSTEPSFYSDSQNALSFQPRTEQTDYVPSPAPTNNYFLSQESKPQTDSKAYSTYPAPDLPSTRTYQESSQEKNLLPTNPSNGIYPNGSDRYVNENRLSPGIETKPRKRRGNLPKETTDKLRAWFVSHLAHPYPTEDEKQQLMDETGLQMNQISNWYINARRRQLPTMAANARAEAEARRLSQCGSNDQNINNVEQTIRSFERFDASYLPKGTS
ncbi:hypothetical protein K3495_g4280 [Podosphaera aphanis]|nr:hypothetical protein K3495_g4280 [Podosphaera aphanis]